MVQMSSSDQAIIKAMPGNDKCMECGMKSPQWASVSFGTLFCLECSGVHRSLGVHISFVRSVAMDSWTEPQLNLMKTGGNAKCAKYLTANGVSPGAPIKAKYESRVAQHYKEVLKARVAGRPDPPPPAAAPAPSASSAVGAPGEDPNGMERLTGETDEQYVARQTRLREEARTRMAAKFGAGGGMSSSSSSSNGGRKTMAGIGSDSSYNPSRGGYGGGGVGGPDFNVDSLVSGFGSAFATMSEYGRSGARAASAALSDQRLTNELADKARSGTRGFWDSISSAANDIASTITRPDDGDNDDGLSGLAANVRRADGGTSYEGFGGGGLPAPRTNVARPTARSVGATTSVQRNGDGLASRGKPKPAAHTGDDFFSSFGA